MSVILALDLSLTSTGYTIQHEDGDLVFDRIQFKTPKGLHPAVRYAAFNKFINELLDGIQPDFVIYEEPQRFASRDAALSLLGLATRVMEACAVRGIIFGHVNPSSLKKWATGNGRSDKDMMKAAAMEHYPGYDPSLDPGGDIADSLHIYGFAKAHDLC